MRTIPIKDARKAKDPIPTTMVSIKRARGTVVGCGQAKTCVFTACKSFDEYNSDDDNDEEYLTGLGLIFVFVPWPFDMLLKKWIKSDRLMVVPFQLLVLAHPLQLQYIMYVFEKMFLFG